MSADRVSLAVLQRRERRAHAAYQRIVRDWGMVRDSTFREMVARKRRTWAKARRKLRAARLANV